MPGSGIIAPDTGRAPVFATLGRRLPTIDAPEGSVAVLRDWLEDRNPVLLVAVGPVHTRCGRRTAFASGSFVMIITSLSQRAPQRRHLLDLISMASVRHGARDWVTRTPPA
jgi:hypothetical protein